jgi:DNA-binding response OmpR family regulator
MCNEKRVIVVEDDRDINELISYNLSREGFKVETAYDGIEASEKLARENFDIVILDIMLPGMDGFHICKNIKDNPSAFKTFVVIISAKAESQDKIYGNLVGADCYLTKPFRVARLMEIVKELVTIRDKDYFVDTHTLIKKQGIAA